MHRKTPPGSRRPLIRAVALVATCLAIGAAATVPAHADGHGVYRVAALTEDRHDQVGMGAGWLMLSYKANGPMVGYLFADGFIFADGRRAAADRFDLRGSGSGTAGYRTGSGSTHTMIHRWPWGYAAGGFDGCAYLYGDLKIKRTGAGFTSERCRRGPTVRGSSKANGTVDINRWWHSERVFCRRHKSDQLCSPDGVWSANKGTSGSYRHTHTKASCPVYANIGSRAVYGGAAGTARPQGLLGTIDRDAEVGLRYVTKSGWAMVKSEGKPFIAGIKWGFVDRAQCLEAGR
jgi:hypothetical protein